MRRLLEWRLAAFSMQQNAQLQMAAVYDARIATLNAVNAAQAEIAKAESERADDEDLQEPFDRLLRDQVVRDVGLFALGSLLAGYGRAMEMIASQRAT